MSDGKLAEAIILAGGASRRFGSNKALADVGGVSLLQYEVDALLGLFRRVLVVAKQPGELELRAHPAVTLVSETAAEQAALVGLCCGLRHATTRLSYVVGCDMPGVTPPLIRRLHHLARGAEAAFRCSADGRLQPLGAWYSRRALPLLSARLAAQDYRLFGVVSGLDHRRLEYPEVRRLDPELRSFWNANTPQELAAMRIAG